MSQYVLHFRDIDASCLPLVGGKGANLGEMTRAGFPIPSGFCITTQVYRDLLEGDTTFQILIHKLENISSDDLTKIEEISREIRSHISHLKMDDTIHRDIIAMWKEIGEDKSYAVRSSATAEDLPGASFAGQQDTYLNIKGETELLESIQNCFASLFTARAVVYRTKNNFPHKSVFLSVVVQEMVFSDVSGIMFTADPISGKRNTISIDASFGLGEAIVGGLVEADNYQVYSGEIVKKQIRTKKIEIVSSSLGTIEQEISKERQDTQALTDEQILTLALLGTKIEAHYHKEQDIEWCLFAGEFFIVQSRPITSLYPLPVDISASSHLFLSIGHLQMMTEAMKPLGISVFTTLSRFLEKTFDMKNPLINEIGGRLYIDLVNLFEYTIFRKNLPKLLSNADESAANIARELLENNTLALSPGRSISRSRFFQLLIFFLGEVRLFLFGNFEHMFTEVNVRIQENIDSIKRELKETPQSEKIRKIQSTIPKIPLSVAKMKIIRYMPLAVGSYRLLSELSQKWLSDTHEIDALGKAPEGNVTTEMGLELGDIADLIRANPRAIAYFEHVSDADFWHGMRELPDGENIENMMRDFFSKYGMRATGEIDITRPRWYEVPTQVAGLLLNTVSNSLPGEHRANFLLSREAGERAKNKILERLSKTRFGFIKKRIMAHVIRVHRATIGIREHPKYFLVQVLDLFKQELLEIADEFVNQGILEVREDIYFLTLDEIHEILQTKTLNRELLGERKNKFLSDQKRTPPRIFLGDGEILRSKSERNIPAGAISGTPASAGIVEGRARIVRTLDEARLEKGDILVTAYTDPAWTTLFASLTAVVTEVGGLLTHGAVVAREYGIPAVVGVDDAMLLIPDGATIRVNGEEGYIEILVLPPKV